VQGVKLGFTISTRDKINKGIQELEFKWASIMGQWYVNVENDFRRFMELERSDLELG
jgi:hypothetical protein